MIWFAKMNISKITNAPIGVEFGGKKYLISELTDEDFGIFERKVQDIYLDVALRNINNVPENLKKDFLNHAYNVAANITSTSPEAEKWGKTVDGITMLLWLGMRHNHPDLTYEECRKMTTNRAELEMAVLKLNFLLNDVIEKSIKKNKKKQKFQITRLFKILSRKGK